MAEITPAQMRANFPEFGDTSAYPDSMLQFWLTVAYQMLNVQRWGRQLDLGVQLYAGHNAVLERQNFLAAQTGALPGYSTGIVSSKGVGAVSVSYDTVRATYDDAGFWNLTTFGTRFWFFVQMFGAGPVQIGIGMAPNFSGGAWAGPWVYLWPNPSNSG